MHVGAHTIKNPYYCIFDKTTLNIDIPDESVCGIKNKGSLLILFSFPHTVSLNAEMADSTGNCTVWNFAALP